MTVRKNFLKEPQNLYPEIIYLYNSLTKKTQSMKPLLLLPIALLVAVVACNQPKDTNSTTTTNATPPTTIDNSNEPKDSGVYFVNLKNGEIVKSPVIVQMGVKGKTVVPMGTLDVKTGHHHLIIDGSFTEKGQIVNKDSTHLHFGKGQTVDTLKLSPGTHTLTLQFADGVHQSYGKDWSNTITIVVKP